MLNRLTLYYLYQISRKRWKWFLLSLFVTLGATGVYLHYSTPVYQSYLLFLLKPTRGMGDDDDPYKLFGLAADKIGNNINNELYTISSSLFYRKAANFLYPDSSEQRKDTLALILNQRLNVQAMDESSLLYITCKGKNPIDNAKTLNAFFDFILLNDKEEYLHSSKTAILFLEQRILSIQQEIGKLDKKNADFAIESKSIDARTAYGIQWKDLLNSQYTSEEIESEIEIAKLLYAEIRKIGTNGGLLPYLQEDGHFAGNIITSYNKTWLSYDLLRQSSSTKSFVIKNKQKELEQLYKAALEAIKCDINQLSRIKENQDNRQAEIELSTSHSIEKISQYSENKRQLRTMLSIYVLLHLRKEEINIKRQIYKSNLELIDPASPYQQSMIYPHRLRILAIALVIGLLLPLVIGILRDKLDYLTYRKQEYEKFKNISIFGEISGKEEQLKNSIEIMRANILLQHRQDKVILFTSTLPSEGKTFISRNLALSMAETKKRVILIDADIRKATQSKTLKIATQIGVTTYLSGITQDIHDVIKPLNIDSRLSFIPCGSIPSNPSELLTSPRWEELVTQLRKEFDLIIIDSVPA
ncbi:MAG: AAA family ATPase, partial [Bacteroidaceae bacterium]